VEGENGAKLCIHHRDFQAGKLIVDNIAENIAQTIEIYPVPNVPSSFVYQADYYYRKYSY
jgi:hypothetical protein